MQTKCKSKRANPTQNKIVHKHNEDILPEDEHKCPHCPKITNNQVSLVNHINTVHNNKKEKWDTCENIFDNREILIKHIVDQHTDIGIQQRQGAQEQLQQEEGQQHLSSNQESMLERYQCQSCYYETNNRTELEFHNKTMHWHLVRSNKCHRCNTKLGGDVTMENHQCRLPQDDAQNTCNFCKTEFGSRGEKINHICQQHYFKTVEQQKLERRRANTECKNGLECWRASRNKCWFMHSVQVNNFPHPGQGQTGGQALPIQQRAQGPSDRPKLYCQYQDRCFKGVMCTYLHINKDFLQRNPPQARQ